MFSFCFIVSLIVTHLFKVSVLCIEVFWLEWLIAEIHTLSDRDKPHRKALLTASGDPYSSVWLYLFLFLSHSRCLLFFLSDDEKNSGWRFHKSTAMVQLLFTVSLGDCHLNLIPAWGRTLFFLQENEKKGNNLIIQEVI